VTGDTPDPLDLLREHERFMWGDATTEEKRESSKEFDAALAQVADVVEAAQAAHAHLPEQPNKAKRLLDAALAPFPAHKDTNHA